MVTTAEQAGIVLVFLLSAFVYLVISGDGSWLWHAMYDGTWLCNCERSKQYKAGRAQRGLVDMGAASPKPSTSTEQPPDYL